MIRSALITAAVLVFGLAAGASADPWDHHGGWGGDHHGWGPGSGGDWISLGTQTFEGRHDRESNFLGWGGHHVDRIAFRPIDNDAKCMSIVATFENGDKFKIVSGEAYFRRGDMAVYDLPGRHRDITKLYMRCRALGDWRVGIEIFARR